MRTIHKPPVLIPLLTLFLLLGMIGYFSACSTKSTEPEPNPEPAETLMLSEPYAAMVKGGNATIVASSTEGGAVTAVSGNPSIAQVSQDGGLIHISAADYGRTTVTVTAANGRKRDVPVTVYDPRVLDNGELEIKFVKDFQNLFYSGERYGFWLPDTTGGFAPLGVVVGSRYDVVAVVRGKEGSDAVTPPESFELLWCPHYTCEASGQVIQYSRATSSWLKYGQPFLMTFWRPVPRPGYKALGFWAQVDRDQGSVGYCSVAENPLVCVREDLVAPGQPANHWKLAPDLVSPPNFADACGGSNVWQAGPWQDKAIRPYNVDPRSTTGEQYVLLPVEAVALAVDPVTVPSDADMSVLRVSLPRLNTGDEVFILPEMTSIQEPTEPTVPMGAWEIVIPYMMLDDNLLTPQQQYTYSPLYRLERKDFYVPKAYTYNTGNSTLAWQYSIEQGIETSTINEVYQEYSISISYSAGISIKGIFNMQTTVNVSATLGYRHSSEYKEWEAQTQTFSPQIPAKTAVCVWQKVSRFILKRHSGTQLEEVKRWDAPSSTHILTMYPPQE